MKSGGIAVLGLLLALAFGCNSSPTSTIDKVVIIDPVKERLSGDQFQTSNAYMVKLFETLNQGKATAEMFTADFRKKAAPPRPGNEDDKKRGYDILRFDEYLRSINTGKYLEGAMFQPSPTGPYMMGEAETETGRKESFLLHLIPTDDALGWKLNWLHRSRAANAGELDLKGDVGPALATVRFAENLIGGDLYLAEAMIAPAWKQGNHPEVVPADQGLGFNRSRVFQTLRGWRDGATDYLVANREESAAGRVAFDVVAVDSDKNIKRILGLTLAITDEGDWRIEEIEAK